MDSGHEIMALGINKLFDFCNELITETEQYVKQISAHTKEKEETCHLQKLKQTQNTEKEKKKNTQSDISVDR